MASEEFAEGSRIRRRDPNLYLGLPPLPGLPGRPGMIFPMPDAPAPQEMPPLPVAYSPSNALSTPELLLTEPMLSDWLDALRAGEHAVTFGAPSYHATVSPSLPPPQRVPLECVERLPHPLRVAPAAGGQMISTRELRRSTGGAIEDMTPELRLRRVIQVSQHHNIVRPGLLNHNQRSTSPEAERLVQAIHQSHIALDALRRQKLDGKMGADNKDGNCGCYSSFECNICLEAAKEPIVTQCGHLFCWPCLYQWLHGHSAHSECPVCKGEVLEVNVTPIYGRGGDERDAASNNIPPRPRADRTESLRQQLQISDPRGIASMVRRLMENQDIVRGQAAPPVGGVEVTVFPAATPRARVGIQQRRNLASPLGDTAPESGNQVQLLSSNPDDAAPTDPQQSSSLEQASTSSNVAVIVGQVAQSRRSRPLEFTTTRRTRRRQQE